MIFLRGNTMINTENNDVKVKSLFKALKVLECFTEEKPELGVTEISETMGIFKSNVFNILSTFEAAGYIVKNQENNKYRLGLKILELAYVVNSNIDFRKSLLPYLQEISQHANEVVYLGIPHGDEVVYLDMVLPRNTIPPKWIMGENAPLYSTAIGKAMLAYFPDHKVKQIIDKELVKITENTITDKAMLYEEIEKTRQRGYAIDNMENEYGIKCIGKAILDRKGQVIAGISISGPSLRFTDDKIRFFNTLLNKYIGQVSERI